MRVLPHVLTLKRTNLARPETRTHSGALNVPWGDLVFEGELKTTDELRAIFDRQGVDLHRPIIASCGSGVTACVVIRRSPRSA